MSRIYFEFEDGTSVEIAGAERARMGVFTNDLATPCYGVSGSNDSIRKLIPLDSYIHNKQGLEFVKAFELWSNSISDSHFRLLDGKQISTWEINLNTAYVLGNASVRLFVRLHAQCEIHCWAKKEDILPIRNAIEYGLKTGLYRDGMGWQELVNKLRTPMSFACSYSVTEGFPNPYMLNNEDIESDDEHDRWYALPYIERWRQCIEVLEAEDNECTNSRRIAHLKDNYFIGDGLVAFDIARIANQQSSVVQTLS